MSLKAGGCGTHMWYQQEVFTPNKSVIDAGKNVPNFSNSKPYYDNFKVFANYVKDCGSYGLAMDALKDGDSPEKFHIEPSKFFFTGY
jgi:hypothetical protein